MCDRFKSDNLLCLFARHSDLIFCHRKGIKRSYR